ncbi:hypothetical protein, partial [Streptomyces sp. AF1A]|uniref:hypothetical protein n=1 Tax=Streptomyces sp. AF1A TaxID=3394350 RepID=UPI0039BD6AFE
MGLGAAGVEAAGVGAGPELVVAAGAEVVAAGAEVVAAGLRVAVAEGEAAGPGVEGALDPAEVAKSVTAGEASVRVLAVAPPSLV